MTAPVITATIPRLRRRRAIAPDQGPGPGNPKPGYGTVAGADPWLPRERITPSDPAAHDPASLFSDPNLNAQALFTIAAAAHGAADYGEAAAAIAAAHRGGSGYEAFYHAFRSLGQQVSGSGRAALTSGNLATARGFFLRAASYLAASLHVAAGTGHPRRQAAAYRAMDRNWALAAELLEPAAEPVHIRSGQVTMPGWLLRSRGVTGAPGRRPVIIFTGGGDTQHISTYAYGAAEALARGYHALLVEGPGQGSLLYLRGAGLRPEWETVITPVLDFLQDHPDVDPRRIVLVGWGVGGALAARAAAHEHRLAALVLDPGVTDLLAGWQLPASLVQLASADPREADAAWATILPRLPASLRFSVTKAGHPFRQPGFSALVRELARYQTAPWLPGITAPTLLTQYEAASGGPGAGPGWLGQGGLGPGWLGQGGPGPGGPGPGGAADQMLRCPHTVHTFGSAATRPRSSRPAAPQHHDQVVFDWLASVL
jgi:hypothetical protein